jgi:4-hydroxybenzoate polyprenyltransferase
MNKWWQFTVERFDPISHFVMVGLYVFSHYALYIRGQHPNSLSSIDLILLVLGTVAFFYKLRLYDEIKDYELDVKINPTRPLARGLVTHSDLYRGIAVCILLEIVCFANRGLASLLTITVAILYSLLMYKEFFIRDKIRPYLTTYAVSHTVISTFISFSLFSAFEQVTAWNLDMSYVFFALNSWCLFNIFEFGRKTFTEAEERQNVESYSKIFGRVGAFGLVVSMAAVSAFLLHRVPLIPMTHTFLISLLSLLCIIGMSFAFLNKDPFGKIYRGFSSFYIVIVYGYVALRMCL